MFAFSDIVNGFEIPPMDGLILYGVLTQVSIVDLPPRASETQETCLHDSIEDLYNNNFYLQSSYSTEVTISDFASYAVVVLLSAVPTIQFFFSKLFY